ncbi:acyl carrier protein [Chengkuizengella axinellae]|uniref:Acyl carrier protein n=1 Tax=Chengkuizengella axinellae TaxID=3064388 RepID=A0ABT9IZE5_9BACL|nr:acyl carrier protein [Chengkuizengella sp. 2205SS18-9]MDP5274588.1 acyl carrier protein [Chengkuizengella sp. 2205SS18-9]
MKSIIKGVEHELNLKEQIADSVSEVLNKNPEEMRRMSGDELLNIVGMDSINCMEIVVSIEEKFSVVFNDDELLIDNLNTINKLCAIVEKKLKQVV